MSQQKYFHAENCNRFIRHGGHTFSFSPYELLGGTWHGVYATSDTAEITALEELLKDKTSAVTAISKERYESCVEKKAATRGSLTPSLIQHDQRRASVVSDAEDQSDPGSTVDPEPPAQSAPSAPLENPEAALTTGTISESQPPEQTNPAPAAVNPQRQVRRRQ